MVTLGELGLSDNPRRECPQCGRGVVTTLTSYCRNCDEQMELQAPNRGRDRFAETRTYNR
jgi:uncharacterized protein (DUF983 family)